MFPLNLQAKSTTENDGEDQLLPNEHLIVSEGHMMVGGIQPENDVTDNSVENAIDDEDLELEEQFIQNIQGIPYVDRRFYFPETWLWDTVMIEYVNTMIYPNCHNHHK